MAVGPIQLIAIAFEEFEQTGKVLPALEAAQYAGAIRVLDLQFVQKPDDENIEWVEMTGLSEEEELEFGTVIGALIGAGAGAEEGAEIGAISGAMAAASGSFGLTMDDIIRVAKDLPAGGAAALLLIEHTWAIDFRDAAIEAGGEMVAQGFLTPQTLLMMGAELEAQAEAAAAIEEAYIVEEEAAYRAELAVALSELVQAEAGRRAAEALVAAAIIEEAALEEAATVMAAAYLIEEAAIEEAEAAVMAAEVESSD